MYYRTYRPQTIETIDNSSIRDALGSILKAQHINHAYIFTGPRGTGKTSSARIFAKAVNCFKNVYAGEGKSYEPCNECESCVSITKSQSVDVLEMDAASNRNIDDIRELVKQAAFTPIVSRYKVYIIDEVHMLTTHAFNALLKTLEEPPKGTIFILATTNIEALPKTVVSRCIVLNFLKATDADIVTMLGRIVKAEKLEVDEKMLAEIAASADGAFRDGAKLLEQFVVTKQGNGASAGTPKSEELLKHLEKADVTASMQTIMDMINGGNDFTFVLKHMLACLQTHFMKLNHIKGAGAVRVEGKADFAFDAKDTVKLMALLQRAYGEMKYTPVESVPLELVVADYVTFKGGELST